MQALAGLADGRAWDGSRGQLKLDHPHSFSYQTVPLFLQCLALAAGGCVPCSKLGPLPLIHTDPATPMCTRTAQTCKDSGFSVRRRG